VIQYLELYVPWQKKNCIRTQAYHSMTFKMSWTIKYISKILTSSVIYSTTMSSISATLSGSG
jgi:ribosome-associated toxin RatA of RatAB toxin-antitoxin module